MKALIFAAGRGERMRPLTDHTPKPLLEAGGKPLIVWHLEKLAALGIRDVVINTSHLADRFPATLGDGRRWGLQIHYLYEGPEPLETGGGLRNALPLLDGPAFIAIAGDVWTDFDLAALPAAPRGVAHLVMVDNPAQHPGGDFALDADDRVCADGQPRLTFSGIGLYRPALLDYCRPGTAQGAFKLRPVFDAAIADHAVHGIHYRGRWTDVGTPERLTALDAELRRDRD